MTTTTTTHLTPVQVIQKRRKGGKHSRAELQWWIQEYTNDKIPDYQMAAWLMAACFHELDEDETAWLTECMVASTLGGPLQWKDGHNDRRLPLVDKHSTGGVGDKVSLILAPLVACLGTVQVPMIAGRGLGHTGGTIDKLESLFGFNTTLVTGDFQARVQSVGCSIVAAGPTVCPADQKLYALRDVTSTVHSIPLQTASIMCKKIAEHPDSLILDVKYGSGAFQTTTAEAAVLAKSMVFTGDANGLKPTTAFLTQMHQPLGRAVGNWLEVQECLDIMRGGDSLRQCEERGCYDLIGLVCVQAGQMWLQSGAYPGQSLSDLVELAYETLHGGKALPKFCEMTVAQGADPVEAATLWSGNQDRLYPPVRVTAPGAGRITGMQTTDLGFLAVSLGAGRRVAGDAIDPMAGLCVQRKIGDVVQVGDVLLELYAAPEKLTASLQDQAAACITIEPVATAPFSLTPVVTHAVTIEGGVQELADDACPGLLRRLYNEATERCNQD